MGRCVRIFLIFLVCTVYGVVWAGGAAENISSKHARMGNPDTVYAASDWVLNIYLTQKGTRSQGSHGSLSFKGKEISGKPGEIKKIPIGTVEYTGSAHEKSNLWDASGWKMKDPLVKPKVNSGKPDFGTSRPNMQKLDADFKKSTSEDK